MYFLTVLLVISRRMIEYLAAKSGNKCIRINNHEHTEVQEYIGGYVTGTDGCLVFRDGHLIEALRNGYWIILDELNLAPSDVLEALNRLLDDNREFFIPETSEFIRPKPGFHLFATQNPAGLYGGRKQLSRAFRNRFIEIVVNDLPSDEIRDILTASCGIAPKFSKMLVDTMDELQIHRQLSSIFHGKHGSITLRDLIKWGRRQPNSALEVAQEGYMVIGEKLRTQAERSFIQQLLSRVCNVQLDVEKLYHLPSANAQMQTTRSFSSNQLSLSSHLLTPTDVDEDMIALMELQQKFRCNATDLILAEGIKGIGLTSSLCRMWKLVSRGLRRNEPLLLVGCTGTGKTTVCQLQAAHRGVPIRILNCHQFLETADIIGGLRPLRGRQDILEGMIVTLKRTIQLMRNHFDNFTTTTKIVNQITDCTNSSDRVVNDEDLLDISCLQKYEALYSLICSQGDNFYESLTEIDLKLILNDLNSYIVDLTTARNIGLPLLIPVSDDEHNRKKAKIGNSTLKPQINSIVHDSTGLEYQNSLQELIISLSHSWTRFNSLFEWQDGPLIEAMLHGYIFVLDEINLADDAVIERLNSVLESGREITLTERSGQGLSTQGKNADISEKIIAHSDFKILATMNPSGDFGKRELSPALRSRFTEVWVEEFSLEDRQDVVTIICEVLQLSFQNSPNILCDERQALNTKVNIAELMLNFMVSMNQICLDVQIPMLRLSVRDLLAWANFINNFKPQTLLDTYMSIYHGAQMLIFDGLGVGLSSPREVLVDVRQQGINSLLELFPNDIVDSVKISILSTASTFPRVDESSFIFNDLSIPLGDFPISNYLNSDDSSIKASYSRFNNYILDSPCIRENIYRILRASQLNRPVLLEGPPGVGKSSIIATLAALTGHRLVRINLSEQTEISDLLGTDIPVGSVDEGEMNDLDSPNDSQVSYGKFAWKDGVFLQAMKSGDWVLLDELNLASQSVLEGLNSCFDHREQVYLPDIGQTVHRFEINVCFAYSIFF